MTDNFDNEAPNEEPDGEDYESQEPEDGEESSYDPEYGPEHLIDFQDLFGVDADEYRKKLEESSAGEPTDGSHKSRSQERVERYGKVLSQLAADGWQAIEEEDWPRVALQYKALAQTANLIVQYAENQYVEDLNSKYFEEL